MFSAARCFVPLHPQPQATIPCPWPCRRTPAPTAVSAKPRRWSRGPRRDRSWDDDVSGSDSDADDGFFGQEQEDDEPEQDEPPQPGRAASPAPESAGGQLRGSDVLRALQRAAAAKEARKSKKNKPGQRQGKEKHTGGGEVAVAGEVRPVVIRPEWAARIRELELRVQELADKHHHHQ
ncbi:uncharacterized protein LOC133931360 [Phragmites australis]|uniref:uncharacterized protein LOC133931360 n=1 Tax=Phragmites australis TaxID=29695 RepID=UPI002D792AE3|nr:uncharacterized protein LOC133931360 [Phragmites australis]